ncbi:MAG: helix-turn-helix domain-containing protein [Firmicutes bacterium]|nr:helix-turn-helix domain-containing protein [Bacillota bacterium]
MEQIIQQLIEARKRANLSLEDLQQRTKISLRQLQALENGEWEQIGPAVYIRGFIRRYAQEVGLDPDTLFHEEVQAPPVSPRRRPARRRREFSFAPLLRLLFVIAVAALVVFLVRDAMLTWMQPDPQVPDLPPIDTEEPDDEEDEDPIVEDPEPEDPDSELELIEDDDNSAVYSLFNAEALVVEIEFTGACWTRRNIDGEGNVEETFVSGDEEEWSAEETFFIRLGAPQNVQVIVNGIEVEVPESDTPFNLQINLQPEEDQGEE